jgi:hypothetical protein
MAHIVLHQGQYNTGWAVCQRRGSELRKTDSRLRGNDG